MKKMTQVEANELLFNAIKAKDLAGVKLAFGYGAQIEAEDKSIHRATPLLCAVIHGAAEIVEYLIGLGADVFVKRTFDGGLNPTHTHNLLDYAALDFPISNTQIIDLLLKKGLKFSHFLLDDIVHGNLEVVQKAIAQDEQLLEKLMCQYAIAYAAANRQVAVVHYLYQEFTSRLSWKMDRKTRDAICKASSIELIEWYIETIDCGKVANEILFSLAQTNHVSILKHVREKYRADITICSWEKYTLLMLAAGAGCLSMVQYLQQTNPDRVNDVAYGDKTAFTFAVEHGHQEILEFLLPFVKGEEQIKNAYMIAIDYDRFDIMRWLNQYFPVKVYQIDLVMKAARVNKKNALEFLEELGVNLKLQSTKTRENALMVLLDQGGKESLSTYQYLIAKDLDLTVQDNNSETVAFHACNYNAQQLAIDLVTRCPSLITMNTDKNETLMMRSAKRSCAQFLMELIKRAPELVFALDNEGHHVLHYAIDNINLECLSLMVRLYPELVFQDNNSVIRYILNKDRYSQERYLCCIYVSIVSDDYRQQFVQLSRQFQEVYQTLPVLSQLENEINAIECALFELIHIQEKEVIQLRELNERIDRLDVTSLIKKADHSFSHYQKTITFLKSMLEFVNGNHQEACNMIIDEKLLVPDRLQRYVATLASAMMTKAMDCDDVDQQDTFCALAATLFVKINEQDTYYRLRFGDSYLIDQDTFINQCKTFMEKIQLHIPRDDDLDTIRLDNMFSFFIMMQESNELREQVFTRMRCKEPVTGLFAKINEFQLNSTVSCIDAGQYLIDLINLKNELKRISDQPTEIMTIVNTHLEQVRVQLNSSKTGVRHHQQNSIH